MEQQEIQHTNICFGRSHNKVLSVYNTGLNNMDATAKLSLLHDIVESGICLFGRAEEILRVCVTLVMRVTLHILVEIAIKLATRNRQ